MVTKGFIVSIPVGDDNKYEVRLPFFEDAIEDAEEIVYEATVSEAPGILQGYNVGDVVYCAFEDNDNARPVIIGKLFAKELENVGAEIQTLDLDVIHRATLPKNTTIGDATTSDVANIKDIKNKVSKMGDTIFGLMTFDNTVQYTSGKAINLLNSSGQVIDTMTADDLFDIGNAATKDELQTVQTELEQEISTLETDLTTDINGKVSKSGDTMTGTLTLNGALVSKGKIQYTTGKNLELRNSSGTVQKTITTDKLFEVVETISSKSTAHFAAIGYRGGGTGNGLGACNVMYQDGLAFIVDIGYTDNASTLRNYIKNNNLTVKGLAISHYHSDHVGQGDGGSGCPGLAAFLGDSSITFASDFKVYLPHNLIDYTQFTAEQQTSITGLRDAVLNACTSAGVTVSYPTEDQTLSIADYTVKFNNLSSDKLTYYYTHGVSSTGEVSSTPYYNDFSMIVTFDVNGKRIICPGDIQETAESQNKDILSQPDIYVIEHHGGNYTSNVDFLNNLNPQFAFVQTWGSSTYASGVPYHTRTTTYQCLSHQTQVYHSKETGTVTLDIDPTGGIRAREAAYYNTGNFNAVNAPGMGVKQGTALSSLNLPGKYFASPASFLTGLPDAFKVSVNGYVPYVSVEVSVPTTFVAGSSNATRPLEQVVRTVIPPYITARRYAVNGTSGTWSDWTITGEETVFEATQASERLKAGTGSANKLTSLYLAKYNKLKVYAVTYAMTGCYEIDLTASPSTQNNYAYGGSVMLPEVTSGGVVELLVSDSRVNSAKTEFCHIYSGFFTSTGTSTLTWSRNDRTDNDWYYVYKIVGTW